MGGEPQSALLSFAKPKRTHTSRRASQTAVDRIGPRDRRRARSDLGCQRCKWFMRVCSNRARARETVERWDHQW